MKFFDCNTYAGVARFPPLKPAFTPEDLLNEMDRCGVDKALVNNAGGDFESPVVSNREIFEFCNESERLHPVWNILPPHTGEMEPEELFRNMEEHNVRALRAMPAEHRYLLDEVSMGPFFEKLVIRKIPLFIKADWEKVYAVLKDFPELVLVATDHGSWGHDRYFRPLFEQYKNFHIDTSRYELDGGIEDIVKKYGASRLLFGTSFHNIPMGGASLLLRNARIDEKSREMIAFGNLERIVSETEL